MRRGQLLIVGMVPLAGSCLDDHLAEDCHNTYTCPSPPDAGPSPDAGSPCPGQCVPLGHANWDGPFLVWQGAQTKSPSDCPDDTSNRFYGVAAPAPSCGTCACEPSTGTCALPSTITAYAEPCPGTGSGTAFDPPNVWDGSCTTPVLVSGGVESVTVAPLLANESCAPVLMASQPPLQAVALGCGSTSIGTCTAPGEICLPAANGWTYCISHEGAGDQYTAECPTGTPYQNLYVFADHFIQPTCSPCTCGTPKGSSCTSLVSFYSDSVCSEEAGAVMATTSISECVDFLASSPLGGVSASPPVYTPGACTPSGGAPAGTPIPFAPSTLCCLTAPPSFP